MKFIRIGGRLVNEAAVAYLEQGSMTTTTLVCPGAEPEVMLHPTTRIVFLTGSSLTIQQPMEEVERSIQEQTGDQDGVVRPGS